MRIVCFVLSLFALGAVLSPRSASAAAHGRLSSGGLERQMRRIINADRRMAGLVPLQGNRQLAQAARAHSLDMANRDYLSHITPEGLTPYDRMTQSGAHYQIAGENIGWDNGSNMIALLRQIEVMMMHSSEHRANLLRTSFTHVGIGIAIVGSHVYVTEDFDG